MIADNLGLTAQGLSHLSILTSLHTLKLQRCCYKLSTRTLADVINRATSIQRLQVGFACYYLNITNRRIAV